MVMIMEGGGGGAGSCIGTYYYTYFKCSLFTFHSFYPVFFYLIWGNKWEARIIIILSVWANGTNGGGGLSLFFPFPLIRYSLLMPATTNIIYTWGPGEKEKTKKTSRTLETVHISKK